MKKLMLCLFTSAWFSFLFAQKCPNINIQPLMSKLEVPGDAAQNFSKCTIKKNDHDQTEIINYGNDLVQLDTLLAHDMRDFSYATVSIGNSQMPSAQNINDAKQLAAQVKNMTPDQQKQWAMQLQMQQAYQQGSNFNPAMQDDAATTKLVLETQDIAANKLKLLNDEFAAKFRNIANEATNEINAVAKPDVSKCPPLPPVGLPSCACANETDGKYWKQIVAIQDRYNEQKISLLENYLPKIKALVGSVDYNVSKLNYGDAVKTATLKRMLLGAQSSAFGSAFDITLSCIKDIRETGSNAYLNKSNCDNLVYDPGCKK